MTKDLSQKPIEFSRFLQAANKLPSPSVQNHATERAGNKHPGYLFVSSDKKQVKILLEDIVYIESQKDYLKIVLKNKTIVIRQPMHEMEKLLPPADFIRIHRSYLVAKNAIESWDASEIEVRGQLLPIGRNYREEVLKLFRE